VQFAVRAALNAGTIDMGVDGGLVDPELDGQLLARVPEL
jgi:hypothetical protein